MPALIAYYSRADENYFGGTLRYIDKGNTRIAAEILQALTGADIVRLDTKVPYSDDYDAVVAQGKREVEKHFRPEIKPLGVDISDYDVIAVGTPTWWYTMAPAVLTFLSGNDFSGKTVIPFMTNAGWAGTVIKDMTKESKAQTAFAKEFLFDSDGGSNMQTSQAELEQWINEVKSFVNK